MSKLVTWDWLTCWSGTTSTATNTTTYLIGMFHSCHGKELLQRVGIVLSYSGK